MITLKLLCRCIALLGLAFVLSNCADKVSHPIGKSYASPEPAVTLLEGEGNVANDLHYGDE